MKYYKQFYEVKDISKDSLIADYNNLVDDYNKIYCENVTNKCLARYYKKETEQLEKEIAEELDVHEEKIDNLEQTIIGNTDWLSDKCCELKDGIKTLQDGVSESLSKNNSIKGEIDKIKITLKTHMNNIDDLIKKYNTQDTIIKDRNETIENILYQLSVDSNIFEEHKLRIEGIEDSCEITDEQVLFATDKLQEHDKQIKDIINNLK